MLARELADVRGGVVDDLAAEVLGDVLAAQRDRRRRADVRLRRHGRDVGRHRDHRACRVGARARRGDVDDDGHLRREEALDDPAHRGRETARRVEDEHHRRVVAVLGAVDGVLDELLRDGVDVVREVDGEDAGRVVLRENGRRGRKRSDERARGREIPANKRPGTGVRILSAEVRRPCPRSGTRSPWNSRAPPPPPDRSCSRRARRRSAAARGYATSASRPSSSCGAAPRSSSRARPSRRFTLAGVQWRGSGHRRLPDAVDATAGGARGVPARRRPRTGRTRARRSARATRLATRQPVVGRRLGPHPGACDRERDAGPGAPRLEPGDAHPAESAGRDGRAADRPAAVVGRGREDPPRRRRATRPTSASRSSTTRPVATATREPRQRRS